MKLFLDDLRTPPNEEYIIVRSSDEAKEFVLSNGCPEFISFDHDLGGEDTAMIFVKWLVEQDLDNNGSVIPIDFQFNVHSANPCGAENIRSYLTSYLKQRRVKVLSITQVPVTELKKMPFSLEVIDKTEGEIICTFEPKEKEEHTKNELQGLTIGQRPELLKRKNGTWEGK